MVLHAEVVKFLVETGARVAAKDDTGETALMKACSLAAPCGDACALVSSCGVNTCVSTEQGKSGHVDVIRFLIDAQLLQRSLAD